MTNTERKGQVPPPGAGGVFSTGEGGPNVFRFNPRNADDIFSEFFGFSSPFGSMGGGPRGPTRFPSGMFGDDFFGSFGEASMNHQQQSRKAPPIENHLLVSLEELYKGTTKKMKISREIVDTSGNSKTVEEILTIDIKPGWKRGTKVTFVEKGNAYPNIVPADLVFVVDEKPHSLYTREGNDLVTTHKVSLSEALTGFTVQLMTLDGRPLTIPINNIVHPNFEEVVSKEGMPVPKDPSRKGNLRIKFNIKFPSRLTAEQKAGIKRLLSGP